ETSPSGLRTRRFDWPERWHVRVSGACEPEATPPGRQGTMPSPCRTHRSCLAQPQSGWSWERKLRGAEDARSSSIGSRDTREGRRNLSAFRRPSIDFRGHVAVRRRISRQRQDTIGPNGRKQRANQGGVSLGGASLVWWTPKLIRTPRAFREG